MEPTTDAAGGAVVGEVAGLAVHPVKSCRPVALDEASVAPTGFEHDRTWQVVDDEGGPLTQRAVPELALVQPTLLPGGMRLEAEGFGAVDVARPEVADRTCRAFVGLDVPVGDAGDEAAAWFLSITGRSCRLVGLVDRGGLRLPAGLDGVAGQISFVDAAQLLIVSESSHRFLLERATEPFDITRFRPNVVVRGPDAWAEDTWRRVRLGPADVDVVVPWPRCTIPQIDQVTAERHREPAVVLRRHRWCADAGEVRDVLEGLPAFLVGNAVFGVACRIAPVGATVRVGDPVEVRASGPARIAPPR